MKPIRVIQWATGSKGSAALRELIRRPEFELVGLRVYGADKLGRDAGDIAGLGMETGVIATDDVEAILRTEADCVLYMAQMRLPMDQHDANICRILEAGKNVVAATGYYWPETHGADYVARLEAACIRGGTTLFGTGFSPGFMTERLAPTLTEAVSEVRSVKYLEVCDCSRNRKELIVDVMGCGLPPGRVDLDDYATQLTTWYHFEALDGLAHWLGVTLDDKRTEIEQVIATEDETLPCGLTIRAGEVGATIRRWIGYRGGQPFITSEHRWNAVTHLPGFQTEDLWQIEVEGRPSLRMQLQLSESFADFEGEETYNPVFLAIASPLLNAIAPVCAAPPGILKARVFGACQNVAGT